MCDQGELRLWKKSQKDVTSLALKVEEGSHQSRSGLQKLEKKKDKTKKTDPPPESPERRAVLSTP